MINPEDRNKFLELLESRGHEITRHEDGRVDWNQHCDDIHNGPGCSLCGDSWCEHCQPEVTSCVGKSSAAIMTQACPSCGVPYTEHDGFIGLCRALQEAMEIVSDLGERDPCRLDHHGYCQEHGWFNEGPCPHKRAKDFLAKCEENAKRRRDAEQLMRGME